MKMTGFAALALLVFGGSANAQFVSSTPEFRNYCEQMFFGTEPQDSKKGKKDDDKGKKDQDNGKKDQDHGKKDDDHGKKGDNGLGNDGDKGQGNKYGHDKQDDKGKKNKFDKYKYKKEKGDKSDRDSSDKEHFWEEVAEDAVADVIVDSAWAFFRFFGFDNGYRYSGYPWRPEADKAYAWRAEPGDEGGYPAMFNLVGRYGLIDSDTYVWGGDFEFSVSSGMTFSFSGNQYVQEFEGLPNGELETYGAWLGFGLPSPGGSAFSKFEMGGYGIGVGNKEIGFSGRLGFDFYWLKPFGLSLRVAGTKIHDSWLWDGEIRASISWGVVGLYAGVRILADSKGPELDGPVAGFVIWF